ncbi:sugar-binding transcriptional regulator [Streptococcus cameli]
MKNRNQLIYQTALLYYEENKSQTEIAKQLGISRPTVAQFLKESKDKGIVQIRISPPLSSGADLSKQLIDKFNLQTAIITKSEVADNQTKVHIGKALAEFIEHRAYSLQSIGIGWGSTLYEYVQAANHHSYKHLTIVPMMGGASMELQHLHSNHLCFRLAEKYQASVSYYYAPAIADHELLKEELMKSTFIRDAHKRALGVDLAIVSIGNPAQSSTYKQLGVVSKEDEAEILDKEVIGDALATFYDKEGVPVPIALAKRMVGLSLDELEMMNEVAVVASGKSKAPSLFALLQKGCVDHIIVDQTIAEYLLAKEY